MLSQRLTTITTAAIGTAVIGLGAVVTAAPAAANSADDAFIAQMTALGISFSSPQETVRQGHQVCRALISGKTESDVATDLRNKTNLTPTQVAYFVVDASNAYCPRLASRLA